MKKHKRLTLILSISAGVIITLVVLMFTLFGLNNVSLQFQNNTELFSENSVQSKIINDGEFKKNSCVLFINKDKYIAKIEKENPYLKIINIETVFPNNLIIHCAEREEVFAIEVSERKYFICDEDFKVLKVLDYSSTEDSDNYESTQNNAIVLKGVSVANLDATTGDFLEVTSGQAHSYNFITSMYMNNREIGEIKAFVEKLTISYDAIGNAKFHILLHSGYKIEILDICNNLPEKINILFSIYDLVPVNEYNTHKLLIFYNEDINKFVGQHTKIN